jgi:hypothetical protein
MICSSQDSARVSFSNILLPERIKNVMPQAYVGSQPLDSATELARIGAVVQEGAEHLIEMLHERVRVIAQPLPLPGKADAARVLMIRDCIDLAARDGAAAATFLERSEIATVRLTENQRRKHIIPATPSCIRLKDIAFEGKKLLDTVVSELWTKDDVSSDELSTILGAEKADMILSGRPSLAGAETAKLQIKLLLDTIARFESHFGSFHIWVKQPEKAAIAALVRSLQKGETDHEDFLDEVIRDCDGVGSYANASREEVSSYSRLRGTIAKTLYSNGRGPRREFTGLDHLRRYACKVIRQMDRIRPIELDGYPVLPFEEVTTQKDSVRDDDAMSLIAALVPRNIDQDYLYLRIAKCLPPREIKDELMERYGRMSDKDFNNLQRQCSRQLKEAKRLANIAQPTTRRSCRDAILKLLKSKKIN